MNRKKRRHDGWVYPKLSIDIKKNDAINESLEPQPYLDDWQDQRDGLRGYDDKTKIKSPYVMCWNKNKIIKYNKKNKKLLKLRKIKKFKQKMRNK